MNRREFLKLAGITVAASTLDLPFQFASANSLIADRIRILKPIQVRTLPFKNAVEGAVLLPDSVHQIEAIRDGWVRLSAGFVPEMAVQPMLNPHKISLDEFPAWVEVIAPYAALRAYAAADAPLLARPDHGAVLHGVRQLDDQHGKTWLQVEYGHQTGWVQFSQLQPALLPEIMPDVEAVLEQNRLVLIRDGCEWLQFPAARPVHLPAGEHRIIEKTAAWHSAPYPAWNLSTDSGLHLGGVTRHNDFSQASTSIELPFLAAKVMFGILKYGARLSII